MLFTGFMKLTIDTPKFPEDDKSELVVLLLEIIRQQGETIQELNPTTTFRSSVSFRAQREILPMRRQPLKIPRYARNDMK
jgi:hypothetical protein